MNKWLLGLLILAGTGIILAVYVYLFIYNKPHPDYATLEADHHLSANELYEQYLSDKNKAASLYNDKIVQISGTVDHWEMTDSLHIAVFVFNQGPFGDEGIRCTMLPEFTGIEKFQNENAEVHIKGLCTGYNDTDVILEKGTIIQ